jgi:sec-independent protein translocase protein TatA
MMTSDLISILPPALSMWMPQGMEWFIIAGFGLLIFGKRLPEVGRSLGKGIVEFKKGLKGIGDEIEEESSKPSIVPPESRKQIAATSDQPSEA